MAYLVKWKGYGEEHNSYVTEEDAGYVMAVISAPDWESLFFT